MMHERENGVRHAVQLYTVHRGRYGRYIDRIQLDDSQVSELWRCGTSTLGAQHGIYYIR